MRQISATLDPRRDEPPSEMTRSTGKDAQPTIVLSAALQGGRDPQ